MGTMLMTTFKKALEFYDTFLCQIRFVHYIFNDLYLINL